MFVWPCIIDINNVEDQLDATVTIYWYSNQLNMFRAIFYPSSGTQDCVLQLVVKCTQFVAGRWPGTRRQWLVSATTFQATGRQQLVCIIPQAVKHSFVLLRMGKIFPERCWAHWNVNKLLLLHPIGLLYFFIMFKPYNSVSQFMFT